MTDWQHQFIATRRVARLATVDATGAPHVVPIVYAYDGHRLFTPLDAKPKQVESTRLQRVRNILANPRVAVIIDDYHEEWGRLVWVQIRGRAALVESGADHAAGVALLHEKYTQYKAMPLHDRPLIVIVPDRIIAWRAAGD